jgi:uncharacterized membrane protein
LSVQWEQDLLLAQAYPKNGVNSEIAAKIKNNFLLGPERLRVQDVEFSIFNQIRQSARTNVAVTIRLLEIIAIVMAKTTHPDERPALLRQANMIRCASQEAIPEEQDRQDIEEQYQIILKVLEQHHASRLLPKVAQVGYTPSHPTG